MNDGAFGGKFHLMQYADKPNGSYPDGMGGRIVVTDGKVTHNPKNTRIPPNVLKSSGTNDIPPNVRKTSGTNDIPPNVLKSSGSNEPIESAPAEELPIPSTYDRYSSRYGSDAPLAKGFDEAGKALIKRLGDAVKSSVKAQEAVVPSQRQIEIYEKRFGANNPQVLKMKEKLRASQTKKPSENSPNSGGKTTDYGALYQQSIDSSKKKIKASSTPLVSTDQVTLTNDLGVPQTGTDGSKLLAKHEAEKKAVQESGIGNSLLQRLGIDTVQYGQFESNHFYGSQPTTGKVQKTNVDAELGGETPAQYLDSGKSTTNEAELPTKETNLVTSGIKPASDRAALGTRARYSQEFLADRPNMGDKYSESLTGLRAADASKGLLYASGQYWRETGELDANNNPKYEKIEKGEYNAIKRGNQHAIDFARDKIELVKSLDKQPTFEEAQRDAKEFDFGSDVYGGKQGSAPKPADYPEQSALSPATTAYQPDMSSLAPDVRKAVELTDEPFSVMNSSEEKLREQLRAIKKR